MVARIPSLNVFLSSSADVPQERAIARIVMLRLVDRPIYRGKLNLNIIAWDDPTSSAAMPASYTPQQALKLNLMRPRDCDIVLVIFGSRMGTPLDMDGQRYESGTHWELMDALTSPQQPLTYIYRRTEKPLSLGVDAPDTLERVQQYHRVKAFFESELFVKDGQAQASYNAYSAPSDFEKLFENHLEQMVNQSLDSLPPANGDHATKPTSPGPNVQVLTGADWPAGKSPFPGLRAFTPADAPIFFGRSYEVDRLVDQLGKTRFLAIVGASGSGKTSLVGAGLIPRLKANAITGSKDWRIGTMKPGEKPLDALTDAIFEAFPGMKPPATGAARVKQELISSLLTEPASVLRICDEGLKDAQSWGEVLLVIDQFEELFSLPGDTDRRVFFDILTQIAKSQRVRAIVTLRYEFLNQAIDNPVLAELLRDASMFSLAIPRRDALHEMIARPAELAGLEFEGDLVKQIRDDTGDESGNLALMAYALDELYKACASNTDRRISEEKYKELGGVRGAIGTRTRIVYQQLSKEAQDALPAVFSELVVTDPDSDKITRRRALLSSVTGTAAAKQLVHTLVEARLLVINRGENGQEVIDIAHEALLRQWGALSQWISEYHYALYQIQQVRAATVEWMQAPEDQRGAYLWKYERLEPVYKAVERLGAQLEPDVLAFMRPEPDLILDQFLDPGATEWQKNSHVNRLLKIGLTAIPTLVYALDAMDDNNGEMYDRVKYTLFQGEPIALPPLQTRLTQPIKLEYPIFFAAMLDHDSLPPLVLQRLNDEDERVRGAALDALTEWEIREAIPAAIVCLGLESGYAAPARRSAVHMLAAFDVREAIPQIVERLADHAPIVRIAAIDTLTRWRVHEAVSKIAERLNDGDVHVRVAAIQALAKLEARESIPLIVKLLDNDWDRVRAAALDALIALDARETIPQLVKMLSAQIMRDPTAREYAVRALGRFKATEFMPQIVERLADRYPKAQAAAVEALATMDARETIPQIANLLGNQEPAVREACVRALTQMGVREAIPQMTERLADNWPNVRVAAIEALMKMDVHDAIMQISERLADKDASVWAAAIRALGEMNAREVIPQIAEWLANPYGRVREAAVEALGKLDAGESVSQIEALMLPWNESDSDVRIAAAKALARLKGGAAVPQLVPWLRDENQGVRKTIETLLISLPEADVLPTLRDVFSGPYVRMKISARRILRTMGSDAALALLNEYETGKQELGGSLPLGKRPATMSKKGGVEPPP